LVFDAGVQQRRTAYFEDFKILLSVSYSVTPQRVWRPISFAHRRFIAESDERIELCGALFTTKSGSDGHMTSCQRCHVTCTDGASDILACSIVVILMSPRRIRLEYIL
jgi:hypothetical protein